MNNVLQKMGVVIATGALFASFATAALAVSANTTVTITGNGDGSNNSATVKNSDSTTVSQTNVTTAETNVVSVAKTGGNKITSNTGGDSSISTGDAMSTVTVSNDGSTNNATVPTCGCATPTTSVDISGNGQKSTNHVTIKNKHKTSVSQTNVTSADTSVVSITKTGKNKIKGNTGGSSDVTTGDSTSTVDVTNGGSTNNFPGVL